LVEIFFEVHASACTEGQRSRPRGPYKSLRPMAQKGNDAES